MSRSYLDNSDSEEAEGSFSVGVNLYPSDDDEGDSGNNNFGDESDEFDDEDSSIAGHGHLTPPPPPPPQQQEQQPQTTADNGGVEVIMAVDSLRMRQMEKRRDIGSLAAWTLSSCKAGCGIDKLRNNDPGSFWQSEGEQPHAITIEFMKKTLVGAISLYVDFEQDESYTPFQVSIRVGSHCHDLRETRLIQIPEQTSGYVVVPLTYPSNEPMKVFVIQIAILSNHQNGRDSHLRMVKVHPPLETGPRRLPPKNRRGDDFFISAFNVR